MGIIIDASQLQRPVTGSNGAEEPSVTDTSEFAQLFAGVGPQAVLLATDFDGTLAPIVSEPQRASILPEALEALRRLRPRLGHIAVISGRSTPDLVRRVPVEGVELLGDYGLADPSQADLDGLAAFNAGAEQAGCGGRLERKAASTSIHFRDSPEAGTRLLAELAPLAARHGLEIRPGRLVLEVMPPAGKKEVALARLIEARRPEAVVWAGDDSGDANCFSLVAALPIPHLAVGVASPEANPEIFERCDVLVDGPAGAAALFTRLADWASRAGPGPAGPGSGG